MAYTKAALSRMSPPARWLYDRGIGPIDLARVLGVSTSQISHWCRGWFKPPPEFFAAVEFKVGFPEVREFEALIAERADQGKARLTVSP